MEKLKRKSAIAIILSVVFLASLMMAFGTLDAYAVEVVGSETGLRVNVSGVLAPTDNLAPGDTETSSLTISLDPVSTVQASSLPVWLKWEITGNTRGLGGGNLDDRLEVTVIHQDGRQLYKGSFGGLKNAIEIGNVPKGGSVDISFTVHLPGSTTGNEYQAASIKVKWIVITRYTPNPPTNPPTSPPSESPTITPSNSPTPTLPAVTPFPTPTDSDSEEHEDAQNESETVIEIDEEPLPAGLPKTGELPPVLFYCLGAGVVYIGFTVNRKKRHN